MNRYADFLSNYGFLIITYVKEFKKSNLRGGGTLLLLPLQKVIARLISDPKTGALLHFEYDASAHGQFWGHALMKEACQKAKTFNAG